MQPYAALRGPTQPYKTLGVESCHRLQPSTGMKAARGAGYMVSQRPQRNVLKKQSYKALCSPTQPYSGPVQPYADL